MKENIRKLIRRGGILLLCVVVIIAGYFIFREESDRYVIRCASLASVKYHGESAVINVSFRLDDTGRGNVIFNGELRDKNRRVYTVSKNIEFSYAFAPESSIVVRSFKVNGNISDDTPMDIFNKVIFDTSTDERHFYIEKKENIYLFSNSFSPIFVCVDKSL